MTHDERIVIALERIADVLIRREARQAQAALDDQSVQAEAQSQMESFVESMRQTAKNQEQIVRQTQEMSDRQTQHIQDCAQWHQLMAGNMTGAQPQ